MDILEIMKVRHSVRQYSMKKIDREKKEILAALINECNKDSGLNILILFDEPKCFDSRILWREDCMKGTGAWIEYLLGCNDTRKECRKNSER